MAKQYHRRKTIPFNFGSKHIDYIRACAENTYNIAEGAVRAGKTVDNVYAFAHELESHSDKLFLATGSTAANAKLNIGDANGFGLEWIFRGQCRWGKYRGNDCLIICGPKTHHKQKIIIFAGAALANSFKKIRGNSYGMWIATEINLHHDNTIKEAFNRLLASRRRKIFWDLNPDHPKAKIYTNYIDKYIANSKSGQLLGGVNYEHFTIFDNINIEEKSRQEFISQYEEGSIWYQRDIKGVRCVAEGLIYRSLAAEYAANDVGKKYHFVSSEKLLETDEHGKFIIKFQAINIGVDFGGTGSGHSFTATGITEGYEKIVALASERHLDDIEEIDPEDLGTLVVQFVKRIIQDYGFVSAVNCDSAESVLIRGIKKAMSAAELGDVPVKNARKITINDRVFALAALTAQHRFLYTERCETLLEALGTAIWNPKSIKKERLDDGTSDIDSLDSFEYTFERDIKRLLPTMSFRGEEAADNV
jgi:PBSX family phage terminase large subunit